MLQKLTPIAPKSDASWLENAVIHSLGIPSLSAKAADHISAGVLLGSCSTHQASHRTVTFYWYNNRSLQCHPFHIPWWTLPVPFWYCTNFQCTKISCIISSSIDVNFYNNRNTAWCKSSEAIGFLGKMMVYQWASYCTITWKKLTKACLPMKLDKYIEGHVIAPPFHS